MHLNTGLSALLLLLVNFTIDCVVSILYQTDFDNAIVTVEMN